jgi:hypothetical protein
MLLPYNNILDALIVGAVINVCVLPVIFPELIVPVIILIFEPNVACLEDKLKEIPDIYDATLLLVPYIKVLA